MYLSCSTRPTIKRRITLGVLPVRLLRVLGYHSVDPLQLLVLEVLDLGIDVRLAVQDQRLIEVHVGVVDLLVGCVALTEAGASVLLQKIDSRIAMNVKSVPAGFSNLFLVVAVHQLSGGLRQRYRVVRLNGVEHGANSDNKNKQNHYG